MWILFFIRHCQIFLCLNQFLAQFIIQSAAYLYKRVFTFHLILCILNDWWWWTSFHEFIPSTFEFLWNVNFSTIISMGNFFSVDYLSYLLIMGRSTIYFPKCNFFFSWNMLSFISMTCTTCRTGTLSHQVSSPSENWG